MIEYLPSVIAGVAALSGVAIGYGVVRERVQVLKENDLRLSVRVDEVVGEHRIQAGICSAEFTHKDVYESAVGDIKDRLKRIEWKLDRQNGHEKNLEEY